MCNPGLNHLNPSRCNGFSSKKWAKKTKTKTKTNKTKHLVFGHHFNQDGERNKGAIEKF
jgi:hypothetical protein